MRDDKDDELRMERVERVGEYFKSLFVRSLRLGLDDGVWKRPWEELQSAAGRSATRAGTEADSTSPATSAGNDQGTAEGQEKESV